MVWRSSVLWDITMAQLFHDLIPLYLQHYDQPPSPQWTNQCWGITQDHGRPSVVWV